MKDGRTQVRDWGGRSAVDFMLRPGVDQKLFVDLGEILCDSIRKSDKRDIHLGARAGQQLRSLHIACVNGIENMFSSESSAQIVNYTKMSSTLRAFMKVSQN